MFLFSHFPCLRDFAVNQQIHQTHVRCTTCQISFNTIFNLMLHKTSSGHKQKQAEEERLQVYLGGGSLSDLPRETKASVSLPVLCCICQQWMNSETALMEHLTSDAAHGDLPDSVIEQLVTDGQPLKRSGVTSPSKQLALMDRSDSDQEAEPHTRDRRSSTRSHRQTRRSERQTDGEGTVLIN